MRKLSTLQKVEQLLVKNGLSHVNKSSRQSPSRLTVSVSRENLLDSQIPAFTLLSPTWSNHDFIFLGADPQECEVVLGIDVPHGAPGLHDEAVHEPSVLNGGGVVYGALDGNTCTRGDSKAQ